MLAETGAALLLKIAIKSIESYGRFSVAVSGGSTPRGMHRLLGTDRYYTDIPWSSTDIFWVDERCVPFDDANSNYGAMKEDLLVKIPIPDNLVHPMPVDMIPEDGARKYEQGLHHIAGIKKDQFPVLDLIFLGMGIDGHTASLFPGQPSLREEKRCIIAVKGGNPNVNRLTMTFPVINNARNVVFLVSGKEKAEVVKEVIEKKEQRLPASRIVPVQGNLYWLIDREAASLLSLRSIKWKHD